MKAIIFISLVQLLIQDSLHSQSVQSRYQLFGETKDIFQKGKVYFRYFLPKGRYMDSAIITNGKFQLTGNMPASATIAKMYIVEDGKTVKDENNCEIWLEPGEIKIKAKDALMYAKYSGSDLQEQFSKLQNDMIPVIKENFELGHAYNEAVAKSDDAAKSKLLNEKYPSLFKKKQKIIGEFIKKYPASPISAVKFDEFAGDGEMDLAIVEMVYAMLDSKLKLDERVVKVAERIAINKRTARGMPAIDFAQTDTSGNAISLSSFRGKYVLVDFWAGWCMPCRAENPHLRELYAQYNGKGFEILGVSLDGERKRWTNAIIADSLKWKQVSDLKIFENEVAKMYGITSIPQNILISPEGKILAKNLTGELLTGTLQKLFK